MTFMVLEKLGNLYKKQDFFVRNEKGKFYNLTN
jgi:hypothetical protein